MSSTSRCDHFIPSRNINRGRGRGFRVYLHSNTGKQEFGLDPISAASDPPGRVTNSSALVNTIASSGSNSSCSTNYLTLPPAAAAMIQEHLPELLQLYLLLLCQW